MPESVLDVPAGQIGREVTVFALDGVEDLGVLVDVGRLPGGSGASRREEASSDVRDPERVERRRTSSSLPDAAASASGRRGSRRGRPRALRAVARCRRRAGGAARSSSVRRSAASRATAGSSSSRASRRSSTRSRPTSATKKPRFDLELDEPVPREPPQSLAHRAAGDPERLGELRLPEHGRRGRAAVDDHRADLVVGESDDRAHAERARRPGVLKPRWSDS